MRALEGADSKILDSAVRSQAHLQTLSGLALVVAAEERIPKKKLLEIPRTKAGLLAAIGKRNEAQDLLASEIATSRDPVRTIRLKRAAVALGVQSGDWSRVVVLCRDLFKNGEHDAWLYLVNDRALREIQAEVGERLRWIRESAKQWNRRDIQTLVRAAELLLYSGDWNGAMEMLMRADTAARDDVSIVDRERILGKMKEGGPYGLRERRFSGKILRLTKPYEGMISIPTQGLQGIFFRASGNLELYVGAEVLYSVAWRIRGLRAFNVNLAETEARV